MGRYLELKGLGSRAGSFPHWLCGSGLLASVFLSHKTGMINPPAMKLELGSIRERAL